MGLSLNSAKEEGAGVKQEHILIRNLYRKDQVVSHLDFIEKTISETMDMKKTVNEASEAGVNEVDNESRQVGGQKPADEIVSTGQKTDKEPKPPYMRWNGFSQTWELIKTN